MPVKKPKPPAKLTQDEIDRKTVADVEAMREQLTKQLRGVDIDVQLAKLTPEKRSDFVQKQQRFKEIYTGAKCRLDFMEYTRHMWPTCFGEAFLEGEHFNVLAKIFQRIDRGEPVRAIVNISPRMGKSVCLSHMFPSWYIGKHPEKQIIQGSNKMDLVEKFGSSVRNTINSETYSKIFSNVSLSVDSKAKTKFMTNKGGYYYGIGTTGSAVGFGADLLIVDDPHAEQSVISGGGPNVMPSKEDFEKVYNWFLQTRSRCHPGVSIIVVMQRWAPFDLTGRILEKMKADKKNEKWEVIELPALFEEEDEGGAKLVDEDGQPRWISMWPQRWPVSELLTLRNEMPSWRWQAQYMQNPTSETSSIIKRTDWKAWGERDDGTIDYELKPPHCEFIIQAWDTAFSEKTVSDYSACTTWGVFMTHDDKGNATRALILFDAWRGQVEFPDLKRKVKEKYKALKPDCIMVEAKATGTPLIQELRRDGIPLSAYTPSWQTGDKMVRLNSVADLFYSGMVYYAPRDWAETVIDEVALFPRGQNDDYVDTVSMALIRFRNGGLIALPSEESEEEEDSYQEPSRSYYWGVR